MDTTQSNESGQRPSILALKLRLTGVKPYDRIGVVLDRVCLVNRDGGIVSVDLENRRIEFSEKQEFARNLELKVPAGSYRMARLNLAGLDAQSAGESDRVGLARVAVIDIDESFTLEEDGSLDLPLARELAEVRKSPVDDQRLEAMDTWRWVNTPLSAEFQLHEGSVAEGIVPWARVRLAPGAFENGTVLNLGRGNQDELPALFRGQAILGPILKFDATSAPTAGLDITLAWFPEVLAGTGFGPEDIVVLQLRRDQGHYRELYPHRIDRVNHTVTVRTRSLSRFFTCTPGILLDNPKLVIDAGDEVTTYTAGREITVSGRTVDPRAEAILLSQNPRSEWNAQGWFVFEGVPVGRSDTTVSIGAGVPGHFDHICDFKVRRTLPKKTITRPNTPYAGVPAFGEEGTAFVSTVVRSGIDVSSLDGIDSLRGFLAGLQWNIPILNWFDPDGDDWRSFRLLSDHFPLNEFARLAIDEIARSLRKHVPIRADYPEDLRFLRSLADFVATFEDGNAHFGLAVLISVAAKEFDAQNLTVSPRLPLVTVFQEILEVPDFAVTEQIGCCYVAASYSGWQAARRSSVDSFLRRRHVPRQSDRRAQFGLSVLGGRLFYVRATSDGVESTEVVADHILCGALSMKINRATREPAILAIGLPEEAGAAFDETDLLLFQRQAGGRWTRRVVWGGQAFIDADMDFGAGELPHVVTAVENRGQDLNADLYHLRPFADGSRWTPEPLTWNLPGFPADTQLGMWPRILVTNWWDPEQGLFNRSIFCAFTYFAQDGVSWMAGTPAPFGRWDVTEMGRGNRASLSGLADPAVPHGFSDDVVGFSRVSPYHWASAIAAAGEGSVWYAYGNGVLHLLRYDGSVLDDRIVDVDRSTGFVPQLAVRTPYYSDPAGPPAIAYKDVHGASTVNAAQGIEYASGLDLHFFDLATSHQVPRTDPPARLAPLHRIAQGYLGGFGSRVPFTCGRFTEYAGIVALSVLSEALGNDPLLSGLEQSRLLDETQASLFLNSSIDIHVRPQDQLLEITIHNDLPNEPGAIRSMRLRQRGSAPATLIVTGSTGTVGGGACGLTQDGWNTIANDFINIPIDATNLFPARQGVEFEDVRLTGISISLETLARPTPPQQGAMGLRIDLPDLRAEGRSHGVGFTATATEPSVFHFQTAPFIADGRPNWHIRSMSGRIGHIDVDTHLDFLTWVGIIGGVLTFNPSLFLLAVVDPVAQTIATDQTNDQIAAREGLPLGGLPNQLSNLLAAHALRQAFGTEADFRRFTFEAVHLQDQTITYFLRTPPGEEDAQPMTSFAFFPSQGRNFGSVVVGQASATTGVLLINSGNLPVSLDNVSVAGGSEFVLVGRAGWPRVIAPGAAEQLDLEFRPRGMAGFRQTALRADYNGLRSLELPLSGLAEPMPLPMISVVPRQLGFGVVNVGATVTLQLAVSNDGAAPLTITDVRIEGPDRSLFALSGQIPGQIAADQTAFVSASFTALAVVSGGYRATLVIESNADNTPRLDVSLFGAGAAANLLVMPTQIAFNPSLLASLLPPGLGSSRGLNLYNVGSESLTLAGSSFRILDSTNQPSPHFQLLEINGQPVAETERGLAAGDFLALSVLFRPVSLGDHSARLEITPTGQGQPPVTVLITGRGIE